MSHCLLLRVTLLQPAWHGRPEWPPAPARVFQALVAGAGAALGDAGTSRALAWLEQQHPPIIAAPRYVVGQDVRMYVPLNDLDTKEGDPARLPEIRAAKQVQARHLEHPTFLYRWDDVDPEQARTCAQLATTLYQFGRGVDPAFATADVVTREAAEQETAEWCGTVHFPSPGGGRLELACPQAGTLESLFARHSAGATRFSLEGQGRKAVRLFAQPPKAAVRLESYDGDVRCAVFEIRRRDDLDRTHATPASDIATLTTVWRDSAVARLAAAGLDVALVEKVLVGRKPGQTEGLPPTQRVRLVPLPSIGHEHADGSIRRLLVEVPTACPLGFEDIRWAFSGLTQADAVLVPTTDNRMLGHYRRRARVWTSVTPLALPAARRRIDPARTREEAKPAAERAREEAAAIDAIRQALRHANIRDRVRRIEVQREPHGAHGERAEAFETLPRFPKERLWHARIEFAREVHGPLLLGDGRFVGLGLLRPERADVQRLLAFRILSGLTEAAEAQRLARHLRRAVLACAQRTWGARATLPSAITGHTADGKPATGHAHLHYLVDLERSLMVLWVPDGSAQLARAVDDLRELRAGACGKLALERVPLVAADPLLTPATQWRSVTPYRLQRHSRRAGSAYDAVEQDVRAACQELPPVQVEVHRAWSVRGGVEAEITLRFDRPVTGPLVLGKTRHAGGGLFRAVQDPTRTDD